MKNTKNKILCEARQRAGITQKELADHVGIAEVSYQRIEYGQRPSLRTAIRIARALDTTVETLWGGNPI